MTPADPEPFRRFAAFVADVKSKHVGRDIAGNSKNYVPLSALRGYWTPDNVARVLHAFSGNNRLIIDIGVIKRQYLRIFSTLVYSGPEAVLNLQRLFISYKLTDNNLPWRVRPSEWPDEKFFREFFKEKFAPHQWQFFPLDFHPDHLHDLIVGDDCILPIDRPVQIFHSYASDVEHFDIHDEYNHLERDQPTKKTFVFKIYQYKRYEEAYENELRALRRLSVEPSENVVKLYGSFRQHGSYCLILEYADGGDLGKYFCNIPAPSTPEDVMLFWKSLFQVFWGLDRIHQLRYNRDVPIKGLHQDIRPENILLVRGTSGSPYDFTPKIADFGLYSPVRTAKARASGSMGLDRYGSQRYSSPECCHYTIQRHNGTNMISTSADIFSMGAVLSHTAAWVVGGPDRQVAYYRERRDFHAAYHPRFMDSGYEGCFHDSIEPLPIVRDIHNAFRDHCKTFNDGVTPEVLDWVEKFMLVGPSKDRLRTRPIIGRFDRLMDKYCKYAPAPPLATPCSASPSTDPPTGASDMTAPSLVFSELAPSPSTIDGVSPPPTTSPQPSAQSICRPPLQTVPQLGGVRAVNLTASTHTATASSEAQQESSGTEQPDNPATPMESQQLSPLQTQQARTSLASSLNPSPVTTVGPKIRDVFEFQQNLKGSSGEAGQATADLVHHLEHNLGNRDQFFFIDDSESMRLEKRTISEGFCALAHIAKRLDPDRVELAFASQPRKVFKARRTKRLKKLVDRCEYRGDGSMMESRMGDLVNSVIIPHLPYRIFGVNVNIFARKKVSIYIFTDGDWGDEEQHGDACGVERPIKRLIEEMKRRRLDRTEVSLHFVRFGQKENGRKYLEYLDDCGRVDDMDIVDVKHINTDVEGMVIGPITRKNDDKASEAS